VNRVLRIPAYRRLLAAYTLNELAFTIGSLALALLVYRRTGSAVGAAAFFLFSQFVPALIAPVVVARLDHLSSRAVLPMIYWLEAAVFLVLAYVSDHFSVFAVLGLSLLDGGLALVARALARTATVTVTSAAGLLREGNAIANAAASITFMVGPVMGGAIVVVGGARGALLAVGALFALIGLTLVSAAGLPETATRREPAHGRVRAALGYARDRPLIRDLLAVQAAGFLFFTISIPVEVVFAQHSLHAGAAGYGGLLSAWGAGAVGGSAVYARWRRLPHRELIALGAFALGIGFLVLSISPTLAMARVGAAVAGVGSGI
jgi:MFS family permease